MDRRAFLGNVALGILGVPRVAPAQPARKVYRIGIFGSTVHGLQQLGYVYGEHLVTEPRSGEGKPERYPSEAAELVRRQVDVIVAGGPVLPALNRQGPQCPSSWRPPATRFAKGLSRASDDRGEISPG